MPWALCCAWSNLRVGWVYGGAAVVFGAWFAWSVHRDRARPDNPVLLGSLLVAVVLWLLVVTSDDLVLETVLDLLLLLTAVGFALVLPVAALVNGMVMWQREGHRLANLLAAIAGAGVIGTVTVVLVAVGPGTPDWVWAVAAAVMVVAGWLGVSFLATLAYAVLYARMVSALPSAPIVVLGSSLFGRQVPPLLAGRLDRGIEQRARARAAGRDAVVVVSGGRGPGEELTEAEAMRGYLLAAGIPGGAVLIEDRATTTEENLRLSREVLHAHGHDGPITAVTSDFHVLRTAFIAHRLGISAVVVGSRTARYYLPSAFLREFIAILALHPVRSGATAALIAASPVVVLLAVR